jgi:nicotinamide mononucleotide (NMN) deamidase PncC
METSVKQQIERIHASGAKLVVVTTGAGSLAVSWLLGVPGASRTVLEALVPYSEGSLRAFLGYEPDQHVSGEAARAMARAAYHRAKALAPQGTPVAGVACTAAIVTDRPKKGDHRCHIAWQSAKGLKTYNLTLTKGLRDRDGEEDVVSRLLLHAVSEAAEVKASIQLGLAGGERVESDGQGSPLARLLAERVDTVTFHPDGRVETDVPLEGALLPGSFNPLHAGHERLARVTGQTLA